MSGETYLTMSGNLTSAPKSGATKVGDTWARIRVASTSRMFDRADNQWRDGATVFMDVICWRRLADNVVLTLDKGDRVVVVGKLRQGSYDDQQGVRHTTYEVEADSVGPDLSKSAASVMRRLAAVTDTPTPDPQEQASEADAPEPEPALA
jgi:single-strand DNA-binding protein